MKNTRIVGRQTAAGAIQRVLERWAREDAEKRDAIERARLESAGVLDAIERKGTGRQTIMIKISRRAILIGSMSAVLLAGTGVATAAVLASPQDSSGVIHGCYTNAAIKGSHALVLQDAGTSCPAGTTAISWNAQGPAGPAGPTGPTGPTGPAGPTVTVTATPTQSQSSTPPVAFPDNQANSPVGLGTLGCGQSRTVSGDNLAGTSGWYQVSFDDTDSLGVPSCSLHLSLSAPGNSDLITTVENDASGPDLLPGPSLGYSNDASGTYLIQVTDGTSGTQYTLSLSTS